MSLSLRLTPVAVARRPLPCTTCQDWGTVPDPDHKGQYKPCPEQCEASRRAAAGSRR